MLLRSAWRQLLTEDKENRMDPKLSELQQHGQSVWLDYIDRPLLEQGGLQRLVADGVTGVTTNPSIFLKSLSAGSDYDADLRRWLQAEPGIGNEQLLEQLMIQDVQAAADVLQPVFERTGGLDGHVSLEVSPLLAHDATATLAAVRRLHARVARPNVMIKIPATLAGVEAIERALAEGIAVNITLLFSQSRYASVLQAYQQASAWQATPPASVASFFVSRVDSKVDPLLASLEDPAASALQGQVAIASARCAYQYLQQTLGNNSDSDGRVQRLLWASTGTKNPDYSDTHYVDALIGAHTVNTLPPATLGAFRDHGTVSAALPGDGAEAAGILQQAEQFGLSLDAVAAELEAEGLGAFISAWRELLWVLQRKRKQLAA